MFSKNGLTGLIVFLGLSLKRTTHPTIQHWRYSWEFKVHVTVKIGFSLVTACELTGKNKNSPCRGRVSRLPPQRKPTEEPPNGPQLVGARSHSVVGGFTDDG